MMGERQYNNGWERTRARQSSSGGSSSSGSSSKSGSGGGGSGCGLLVGLLGGAAIIGALLGHKYGVGS